MLLLIIVLCVHWDQEAQSTKEDSSRSTYKFPNAFFLSSIQYILLSLSDVKLSAALSKGGRLNYEANRILQRGKDLNKINDGTIIIMETGTVGTQRSFYYLESETNFASFFSQYMILIYCKLAKSDGIISHFFLSYETQGATGGTHTCYV